MMEEKNMQQATKVYTTLCGFLDKRNWGYSKKEEALTISFSGKGEDLQMDFNIVVDPERWLVSLYSPFPFTVPEEKIVDSAFAVLLINDSLPDGNFDLNIETGRICFRLTSTFRESLLGEELFEYMVDYSIHAVDEFNDKLLMVSKSMLSLEQLKQSLA